MIYDYLLVFFFKYLFLDISECRPFSKKETLFSKTYSLVSSNLEKEKGSGGESIKNSFIISRAFSECLTLSLLCQVVEIKLCDITSFFFPLGHIFCVE